MNPHRTGVSRIRQHPGGLGGALAAVRAHQDERVARVWEELLDLPQELLVGPLHHLWRREAPCGRKNKISPWDEVRIAAGRVGHVGMDTPLEPIGKEVNAGGGNSGRYQRGWSLSGGGGRNGQI